MKNAQNEEMVSSVYPGTYIPLKETEATMHHEIDPQRDEVKPLIKITQNNTNYIIELLTPNLRRENMQIRIDNHLLTFKNLPLGSQDGKCQGSCQQILLPSNIDPTFLSAEYKCGVLKIQMQKGEKSTDETHLQVAVY